MLVDGGLGREDVDGRGLGGRGAMNVEFEDWVEGELSSIPSWAAFILRTNLGVSHNITSREY